MKKKALLTLVFLLISALFAATAFAAASGADAPSGSDAPVIFDEGIGEQIQVVGDVNIYEENYRARVVAIIQDVTETVGGEEYGFESRTQVLSVVLLDGPEKGKTATVRYDLTDTWGGGNGPRPVSVGAMVIVQIEKGRDGMLTGFVTQYGRYTALIWLSVIFILLLAFLGGKKALRSLVALLVTCVGLIAVMVPMIVNGASPILSAILACIFSIVVTLVIVYGFSIKSLAAGLGSVGGVVAAGLVTVIMNAAMHMTGIVDDESMYLAQSVGESGRIDLRGILFAAIIISVLGGTIDVSVSIASALDELHTNAKDMTGAQLMQSGINIGVDIMGASLNTLILSYVGCSLHLLMIFYTYQSPVLMIFNDEMIVCEVLRALAGSIGLLLTVPITALVSAMMMSRGNFGRFSWDCFASVVLVRRLRQRLAGLRIGKNGSAAAKAEVPEDLYALAREHSAQAEQSEQTLHEPSGEDDATLSPEHDARAAQEISAYFGGADNRKK